MHRTAISYHESVSRLVDAMEAMPLFYEVMQEVVVLMVASSPLTSFQMNGLSPAECGR